MIAKLAYGLIFCWEPACKFTCVLLLVLAVHARHDNIALSHARYRTNSNVRKGLWKAYVEEYFDRQIEYYDSTYILSLSVLDAVLVQATKQVSEKCYEGTLTELH